jgi:SAM-dependent methyltransferase
MSEEMPGNAIEIISKANGVVLDMGPGTGELSRHLKPELISHIYAVEPAVDMHPKLAQSYESAGLAGKYDILAASVEPNSLIPSLVKAGVISLDDRGSTPVFDTILSMRVLCGIPNPQCTIRELYGLLKPGGRIAVCEHVVHPWPRVQDILGAVIQRMFVLLGWKFWMCGCSLTNDTVGAFQTVGGKDGWKTFDLRRVGAWKPVPFVVGELTKKD